MARFDFGGDGTQIVLDLTTGNPLANATNGVVYASLTATTPLVDITSDAAGTTFLDAVSTNAHGVIRRFYGPNDVRQVAVDFGSGERFLIDSNTARAQALTAALVAADALSAAQNALSVDDLGAPGGPARLDPATGRLPYAQLPTDIGTGGTGGGGANLDSLVINGKSPVGGSINLNVGDITDAARASALKLVAFSGSAADLTGILPKPSLPPLVKADVGLGSVDNTADANKPVSAAQLAALNAKAPLASPAFTGTLTVNGTAYPLPAAMPISAAQQAALDAKAPVANPNFDGIVAINDVPVPTNLVSADIPNLTFVTASNVDPATLDPGEIAVLDSADVLTKPATNPTTEQVVTVRADGTQGGVALANLGTGGGTGSSVQTTARAILAAAGGGSITRHVLHPDPPTITTTAGSTSSILNAVRIGLKRTTRGGTAIDVKNDPHWEYPGARPGHLNAFTNRVDTAIADYLTGGTSQSRRDYWRLRCEFSGTVLEFTLQSPVTTLRYRVWVDGLPLSTDLVEQTVTAGTNWIIKVDFGTDTGPRVVELEVNDPRQGGAFIGPTDTLSRYKTPRRMMLGFGDSHTAAGANGAQLGESWLVHAARHLQMDPVNMAIGGSGYFASSTNGADFRQRLTPDVVPMNPDMVVFYGGYNDVSATAAATVQTEASYCFSTLRAALPTTVIIVVGPFQQTHTISQSQRDMDVALRAAAASNGMPYISLMDPLGLVGSTGTPAWAASTAYVVGDTVTNANNAWKCTTAHTSGTTFDATKWRALSFITGTGKEGTTKGDGNADLLVGADGIHNNPAGHRVKAHFLATEIVRCLRELAA